MKQKRILVTGASRGIGKACALNLGRNGYDITVHYRTGAEQAEMVAQEIRVQGGTAATLQFDVCHRDAVSAALLNNIEQHGAFYGVVCNAGIAADNAFPALTGEQWDRVIHTNLDAFYNVLNPIIMPMIKLRQGGRIVTLSSVSGVRCHRE